MTSRPQRRVHWKFSAEEYEALNTLDSRATTPDSSSSPSSSSSSSASSAAPTHQPSFVPDTPRIPYRMLPPESPADSQGCLPTPSSSPNRSPVASPVPDIMIDPVLAFDSPACFSLDISFPSAYFRQNPQLKDIGARLNAPASNPARSTIHIFAETPTITFEIIVKPKPGDPLLYAPADGQPYVTIGRILGDLNEFFRKPWEEEITQEVQWYFERRLATVNGGESTERMTQRSWNDTMRRNMAIQEEREKGYRRVDWLLGQTRFRGLSVVDASNTGNWRLHLDIPERYMVTGSPVSPVSPVA